MRFTLFVLCPHRLWWILGKSKRLKLMLDDIYVHSTVSLLMMKLGYGLRNDQGVIPTVSIYSVNNDAEKVRRTQQNLEFLEDDAQYTWVDDEFLGIPSLYTNKHIMVNTYQDVGPSWYWRVIHPGSNKLLCNEYGACRLPLHEGLFYWMGSPSPSIS